MSTRMLWPLTSLLIAVSASAGPVWDETGRLTESQMQQLMQLSARIKNLELCTVVIKTRGGESSEQYAHHLVRRFKIPMVGEPGGSVLLMLSVDDGAVWIETGGENLSKETCQRIARAHVAPLLRRGDVYGAVRVGIEQISAEMTERAAKKPLTPFQIFLIVVAALVVLFLIVALLARLGGGGYGGGGGCGSSCGGGGCGSGCGGGT